MQGQVSGKALTANDEDGSNGAEKLTMTFNLLRWLFPVAVTVHNFEEAITYPTWSQTIAGWPRPVASGEFWFAVIVLTLLAYLITGLSIRTGQYSWATYLLVGYAFAMVINVAVPHLVATVVFQRYMPGLATGLLLNLPLMTGLIYFAYQEAMVYWKKSLLVALGVTLALSAALPILFAAGNSLLTRIA